MAVWEGYTQQIDAIVGGLPPDVQSAVVGYASSGVTSKEADQGKYSAALASLTANGYSAEDAAKLLQIARNVRKAGGEQVGDPFSGKAFMWNQEELDKWLAGRMPGGANGADPARDAMVDKLNRFADSMLAGIDPNDPTALRIRSMATNAAQASAGRAGVSGRSTLGNTAAAGLTANALGKYDMDRKQLGLQAQGLASARDLGLGQLEQGWNQLQAGLAEKEWAGKQNQMQGILSAVGTGLGAVGGAYFGGAQGAQYGMQAGSQLFGGLGGLGAPASPNYGNIRAPRGVNPYTGR